MPKWKIVLLAASGGLTRTQALLLLQFHHGERIPALAVQRDEDEGTLFFRARDRKLIEAASRIGGIGWRAGGRRFGRVAIALGALAGAVLAVIQLWRVVSGWAE